MLIGAILTTTGIGILAAPGLAPGASRFLTPVSCTVALILVGILVWRAQVRGPAGHERLRREHLCAGLVGLICTAISWLVARAGAYEATWDAATIRATEGSVGVPPYLMVYFERYPNNAPMQATARVMAAVGRSEGLDYTQSAIALNTTCLAVILWATYLASRWLVGHRSALLAMVCVFLLIGLSPWMVVAYTDIGATAWLSVSIVLMLAARRSSSAGRRWLASGFALVTIAVAIVIKPMPVVVVVAVVITGVMWLAGHASWRRVGGSIALLFIGVAALGACYLGFDKCAAAGAELPSETHSRVTPLPAISWVAGGLLEQTNGSETSYGGYNGAFIKRIIDKSPEQVNQISRAVIRGQLQQRGPLGTAAFEWRKNIWTWGDGTFWAYREGNDRTQPVIGHTALTSAVVRWNSIRGSLWSSRAGLATGLWCAIILAAGLGLLAAPYREELLCLALSTAGIAAFVLVFQGRSRYLMQFVPIVVLLAATACGGVTAKLRARRT